MCEFAIVDTRRTKPYRVQSFHQSARLRFATDKILNNLELFFTASFESAGVVEKITVVVSEDEFILDIMHATL